MEKKYEVIIDRGSKTIEVLAINKEEAEKKALKEFESYDKSDYEFWVGDCYEQKD